MQSSGMAAAVSLLVIFSIFHSVLPLSFEQFKSCIPSYCGNTGKIIPPPDCGPLSVGGCEEEQFNFFVMSAIGGFYDIHSLSHISLSFVSENKEIQRQLNSSLCPPFSNMNHSILQDVAYHALFNLTLFKCNRTLNFQPDLKYFHPGCQNGNFYLIFENKSLKCPPPRCSVVHLPVNNYNYYEIFGLLAAKVSLEEYKRICQSCPAEEPICELECHNKLEVDQSFPVASWSPCGSQKTKKHIGLKLGLALGLGGAAVMMVSFLLYRYRRIFIPARASITSSTLDLERSNVFFGVPIFTHSELEEATNNFDSKNELGDGGFGTVYYGKLRDGREIAVKRLYEHNYKRVEQFMNEIEILTRLRHKNLVSLYGCTSRHSRELLLVYEYISNGTVADHLHGDRAKSAPLIWPIRMKIAIETASALVYLHASDIIHRDVKTNNILLDNNFCVKVADFGLSRLFPNDVTHVSTVPQGTPGYIDPDYHQCYQLTDKSDVYSFGVVLIELISSMPAVDITRHQHEINLARLAINRIQNCALDELVDLCLGFKSDDTVKTMTTLVAQLAFQCLQQDKELRPSMDDVLQELKSIKSTEYELENH
uniref:non-specific serine/threonine protein kinase n=1 Tax=Rhizophora mucronata TaxID=61149 RepID=A0A2P2MPK7_RHIMU